MSTEDCPQLSQLVEHLAEAINDRKHVESNESHSPEDRMGAEEQMNLALDAVRLHKAEHGCALKEGSNPSTAS